MAKKNITKLSQKVSSELFTEPSDVDVFFSDETLARAARGAAPVKVSGGFLTFIHKTVQESLIASAICREVLEATKGTGVSISKLFAAVNDYYSPGTRRKSLLLGPASTLPTSTDKGALTRQNKIMLESLMKEVANSPIGTVALETEPAVRDFIADQLLDDPSLSVAAHCVAILAIFSAVGLDGRTIPLVWNSLLRT